MKLTKSETALKNQLLGECRKQFETVKSINGNIILKSQKK